MAGEGQEPTQVQGQEPTQPNGDGNGAGTPAEPKTYDESYVKKLRGEAAGYRTQLSTAQAELDKMKQAQMNDLEKAQAAAESANKLAEQRQAELVESKRIAAISQAAAGKFPVAAALKLADVTVNDDGTIGGVDEAIAQLVKDYPGMVQGGGQAPNGSPANPNRPKNTKTLTLDDFKGKSPDYINAHWAEYQAALKASK